MIINGNNIAEEMERELARLVAARGRVGKLVIVLGGSDPATARFVEKKIECAGRVGIETEIVRVPEGADTNQVVALVRSEGARADVSGIVVQLPLPKHIDEEEALNAVLAEKDVDVLSRVNMESFAAGKTNLLPPVVGAIKEIFERGNIAISGKKALVVGAGRLVGKPASIWLSRAGAEVEMVDETSGDYSDSLAQADIIVLGVGKPHFITPDMIKEGAIILDAGTSMKDGKLAGDADPACAEKCALFTPVPGGIGPMTIRVLLLNMLSVGKK